MPLSDSYLEYIRDRLTILGKLNIRRMFGGAGVYCPAAGVEKPPMFAVIDDDQLYFKVDDTNRADYTSRGLTQWVYDPSKPEKSAMPYFPVPEDVLEDDDQLKQWAMKAIAVARSAALRAPKPKSALKTRRNAK